jgi:CheY-like chemotaxis protein/Tfp pilus assembly protein PilZ
MSKRKTILISDSSSALLKHNTIILKKMGFFVVPIMEGLEVIKTVSSLLPNLIILNVDMSGFDGIKILKYIKNNKSTSSIPVVMISGEDSAETRIECYAGGCDAFVEKPVKLRDLHDILQQFIYRPNGYSRKYLRVNADCTIKVTNQDTTYLMESETLSEKGIYIMHDHPFPVDTRVFVDLPLYGGDSLRLNGKVIYINDDPDSSLSNGMAVEFVENDDDTMLLVGEYVKSILNTLACDSIRLDTS